MKALSIRQPWASLIASGRKTIEVRSWPMAYRGPLLVCAGKKPHAGMPVGVALAVVDLLDCRSFRPDDETAACCGADPGDFAWVLGNVRAIDPVPVSGKLGLFTVELSPPPREMERPGCAGVTVSALDGQRSTL